jgi:hypothetical protein
VDYFFSGLPTKILYAPRLSSIRAGCLANLILVLIKRLIYLQQYRSWCSSLCSLLHSPVTSYFLGPNVLPSTLFSTPSAAPCAKIIPQNGRTESIEFVSFVYVVIKRRDEKSYEVLRCKLSGAFCSSHPVLYLIFNKMVCSILTQLQYISFLTTCFGFYKTIFRPMLTIGMYIQRIHTLWGPIVLT